MQSKGSSLNRLSNQHLVRGRGIKCALVKVLPTKGAGVLREAEKENPTLKASTDWLFQQNSAARQGDNELSLIRAALLYMMIIYAHVCVCVCAPATVPDEYSRKIVCGNIPEEQLACCYTHMGGSPRILSQSHDCLKYQRCCRS